MYSGVPNTAPARVRRGPAGWLEVSSGVTLAMPKSTILMKSRRPSRLMRKMFSGLRSRWTMPLAWAAARAWPICAAIGSARASGIGAAILIAADSVVPSTYSMTW